MDPLTWIAVAILLLSSACQNSLSKVTDGHSSNSSDLCPHVNFCSEASRCCQFGVDEYGWIAAAVGWSLWFLTLILLCIDKLVKLRPDEPKYLEA
ncbi:transmembrane protein 213 [Lacerta agilis]|uniref:transmembrane protein 213 n=1 Tax=Lacerta agilis TaxID=80427 RepID=UPI001419DC00|nr:transmembrane protein 213 [Lacerta agilis]